MVGVFPLCSFFSFPHSGLSVVSCVLSVSSSFFHFSSLDLCMLEDQPLSTVNTEILVILTGTAGQSYICPVAQAVYF